MTSVALLGFVTTIAIATEIADVCIELTRCGMFSVILVSFTLSPGFISELKPGL